MKNAAVAEAVETAGQSTTEILAQLTARKARLDELEVRRAGLSDAVQASTEEIAKGVASGKENGLEAVRKKKRADADELDELASAVSLVNGEIKALEAQLEAAEFREAIADTARLDSELREGMRAMEERIDAFMQQEIPRVAELREKQREVNAAQKRSEGLQKIGHMTSHRLMMRVAQVTSVVEVIERYAEDKRIAAITGGRRIRSAGTPADAILSVDTSASEELIEATA